MKYHHTTANTTAAQFMNTSKLNEYTQRKDTHKS